MSPILPTGISLSDMLSLSFLVAHPALVLPIPIFTLFLALYYFAAPSFKTEKARAYILSTTSSLTMSLVSLPFVAGYLVHGLERSFEDAQTGWRAELGRFGVVFFGTYLFADLAIGYFKYPSQIGLLTGWIHHTVYIGLMIYLLNTRQSPVFLLGAIMELPTFDLAVSNLFPTVRHDLRFLSLFFAIRILFHAVILVDHARPSFRAISDGSYVPTIMLTLAFVLHVSWFRGGLQGYLKRRRAAAEGVKLGEREKVQTSEPLVDAAIKLDPSVADATLPATSTPPLSPAGTPEDSPLVTPYTPSITPMSLRDSYLFPALPISMPTMPNLPTMSIPSIPSIQGLQSLPSSIHIPSMPTLPAMPTIPTIPSLADLTSAFPKQRDICGFKDAVRNRWDEQRERFGGIGIGARGRGGMMGIGDLGIRRRLGREADGMQVTVREVGVTG